VRDGASKVRKRLQRRAELRHAEIVDGLPRRRPRRRVRAAARRARPRRRAHGRRDRREAGHGSRSSAGRGRRRVLAPRPSAPHPRCWTARRPWCGSSTGGRRSSIASPPATSGSRRSS
jgi:hypothetical protein